MKISFLALPLLVLVCLASPGCDQNQIEEYFGIEKEYHVTNYIGGEYVDVFRVKTGSARLSALLSPGSPSEVLIALNNSSRISVSDGTNPWGTVDLARYVPTGLLTIKTGLPVGDQVVVGTNLGLVWLNMLDGTYGFFSGLPGGSSADRLLDNGAGSVLVGLSNPGFPGNPPVYKCSLSALSCTLSNTGMTTAVTGASVLDFAIVPGSGSSATIFAGTQFAGVYKSTDGGTSWTPSSNGLPGFVIVKRVLPLNGALFIGTSSGVYRSSDLGGSWALLSNGLPQNGSVKGLDASGQTLYAGVVTGSPAAVYKSTDGGSSWQKTGPGITTDGINALATTASAVFVATPGGTFRSTDGGASWATFNSGNRNASILAIQPAGGAIYAGTFGNLNGVYRSTDAGLSWVPGDATLNNKIVRALGSIGNNVIASGEDGTFRSTNGGATWSNISASLPAFHSIYSLVTTGSTFFAGLFQGGLYKSTDAGATWTAAGSGLPPTGTVEAIAASGNTLVASVGGIVYRSVNGGGSWSPGGPVYAGDLFYDIYSLSFVGNTLYAGIYNFGIASAQPLYKSLDVGLTWAPVGSGLPNATPAFALASVGTSLFAGLQSGLYTSVDGGSTWLPFAKKLAGTPIYSLAGANGTLLVGTAGRSIVQYQVPFRTVRLVPIVLDVDTGSAHYTTELALTNRGTADASVTLTYTASLGSGSGSVAESLPAGKQLIVADVIAYLRGKGLPIPTSGSQGGTLLLAFDGASAADAIAATARTATSTAAPQPVGRAGLAYSAIDPAVDGVADLLTVYGLRSNGTDRSNLAVFNTSSDPVTLKVTAWSGDGNGTSVVVASAELLPPLGWKQYNGILADAGFANGYVTVERVSTSGVFSAYGVVNDNGTNDGSYVLPTLKRTALDYLNVPVLVETPSFLSELALANSGPTTATFTLAYAESLNPSGGTGGSIDVVLAPGTQRIIPSAIAYLRQNGVAIGPAGPSYAGSLHITVSGALVNDTFAGARTASPSPAGGQFGLFTPAFYPGSEALDQAFLYGLRADATNRSNVAVISTGGSAVAGPITLRLQAYDGDAGGAAAGSADTVTLAPGQWSQLSGFLGDKGVRNGWVKITRTSGTAPWIAYGVVNDGGGPGQNTGDGAYVPMTR